MAVSFSGTCRAESRRTAQGVPLSMSRIPSEFLNVDLSTRSLTAKVRVREEPDDEEDDGDNGNEQEDDEDKQGNEGYSE